jgi:hypothetical protein
MFEGAQDRVKVVDRRRWMDRHHWNTLVGAIFILSADRKLRNKTIAFHLSALGITTEEKTIQRIRRELRIREHGE